MDRIKIGWGRREISTTEPVSIPGVVCDGATYLATKRSQENKGYGASLYCNWIGYEGGQEWVEGVLENLNELKKETET